MENPHVPKYKHSARPDSRTEPAQLAPGLAHSEAGGEEKSAKLLLFGWADKLYFDNQIPLE
jgi:hypothetical protein